MADKEVSDLDFGTLAPTGELHFVDASGVSRKATLAQLKTWINTNPTVVPSSEPYRGVLLRRTSTAPVATGDTISWQTALYDTDSMWAAGSPSRITVGPNITKLRFLAGVQIVQATPLAGSISLQIRMNGDTNAIPAMGRQQWRSGDAGFAENRNTAFTPVIPVSEGDYFEVTIFVSGLGGSPWTLSSGREVFFAAEIVEASLP